MWEEREENGKDTRRAQKKNQFSYFWRRGREGDVRPGAAAPAAAGTGGQEVSESRGVLSCVSVHARACFSAHVLVLKM